MYIIYLSPYLLYSTNKLKVSPPTHTQVVRPVWHFKEAAWDNLKCELRKFDVSVLHKGTVDDALNHFMDVLSVLCEQYIPKRQKSIPKCSHPWIDDSCKQTVNAKHAAEGSEFYQAARDNCAATLNLAYQNHIDRNAPWWGTM